MTAKSIAAMSRCFASRSVESVAADTALVVLDIDSTDDPSHGHQQFALFHGFDDQHMCQPLLVFDG